MYEALVAGNRARGKAITVPDVSARSVGALIAQYERAVGLHATLVNVNAYHQPGVEAGKKAATSVVTLQHAVLAALRAKSGATRTAAEVAAQIFVALAIDDIRDAADVFRLVFDRTGGDDGYVSIEVAPMIWRGVILPSGLADAFPSVPMRGVDHGQTTVFKHLLDEYLPARPARAAPSGALCDSARPEAPRNPANSCVIHISHCRIKSPSSRAGAPASAKGSCAAWPRRAPRSA